MSDASEPKIDSTGKTAKTTKGSWLVFNDELQIKDEILRNVYKSTFFDRTKSFMKNITASNYAVPVLTDEGIEKEHAVLVLQNFAVNILDAMKDDLNSEKDAKEIKREALLSVVCAISYTIRKYDSLIRDNNRLSDSNLAKRKQEVKCKQEIDQVITDYKAIFYSMIIMLIDRIYALL